MSRSALLTRPIPAVMRRAALSMFGAILISAGLPSFGHAATAGQSPRLELLMIERDGCIYCRRWHEEIGPAYPRTAEGAAAPLRRHDLGQPLPEGVTLTGRPPVFTPTFILLRDGVETGRIEGYAGDEFFWVLLDGLMDGAGWTAPPADEAVPNPQQQPTGTSGAMPADTHDSSPASQAAKETP